MGVGVGDVGIKVNGEIGSYFCTFGLIEQGDPLSPLLFDLAGDVLAIIEQQRQVF